MSNKKLYTVEPADPNGRWLIPEGSRDPKEWEWIPDTEDIAREETREARCIRWLEEIGSGICLNHIPPDQCLGSDWDEPHWVVCTCGMADPPFSECGGRTICDAIEAAMKEKSDE